MKKAIVIDENGKTGSEREMKNAKYVLARSSTGEMFLGVIEIRFIPSHPEILQLMGNHFKEDLSPRGGGYVNFEKNKAYFQGSSEIFGKGNHLIAMAILEEECPEYEPILVWG